MRRALVTTLLLASGCSGSDSGTNPDPRIDAVEASLAPTDVVVDVGETADLVVTVTGGVQDASVAWLCLSSDPQIASARETTDGCSVTGGAPGIATASALITKGNTGTVAESTVTVRTPPALPPPLEVSLDPSESTIDLGHTVELQVLVSGGLSGALVNWTCGSGNVLVASVISTDSGCEVTGGGPGGATITATVTKGSETVSASAAMTVLESPFPPLQVFLQPNAAGMLQGETAELSLLVLGGDPAVGFAWTCTAADPEIAAAAVTGSGCEMTGFDSGSTVVSAVVTRGFMVAQADANIIVTEAQGRAQTNPAPIDWAVTVIVDDAQVPWTTLRLTLLEAVTGAEGVQMALAWSPQNVPPPTGFEYIMARFRVEVVTQADPSEAYQESEPNFESVSRFGVVHPASSVCCSNPSLGQAGFTGAVWEGWVALLSENNDLFPLAVYRRGESSEAWFALKPAP